MSSRITPPAADTGSTGRRWTLTLAGIVVLAIIACAIFLLANRDGDNSGATNQPSADQPYTPPSDPGLADPTDQPSEPPKGRCDLPAGDQAIPTTPIHGAEWSLVNKLAVPANPKFGPQIRDDNGLRRCFAHSPTGAVYAVYNLIASLNVSDNSDYPGVARKVMTAGPGLEAHLQQFARNPPDSSDDGRSVALSGFKIVDATRNRATILVAFTVGDSRLSSTWTLVWVDGDWKLRSPAPGENPGDPATPVADLTGFVPWTGI